MNTEKNVSLVINTHDFQKAKNSLKKYVAKKPEDLSINKVATKKWKVFTHHVHGDEFNVIISQIQDNFVDINTLSQGLIDELGQIYKAFDSLDKDYISGIVASIKAAEKVSNEEQKDRVEIKRIIGQQAKAIEVLKQFKSDIDKLKHITDVDTTWDTISKQKKLISALFDYKETLCKLQHLMDVDSMWLDITGQSNKITEISSHLNTIQQTITDCCSKITVIASEQDKTQKDMAEAIKNINDSLGLLDDKVNANNEEINQKLNNYTTIQEANLSNVRNSIEEDIANTQNHCTEMIVSTAKIQDNKIDKLDSDLKQENAELRETIGTLNKQIKIAYIIAGASALVALVNFVINYLGII